MLKKVLEKLSQFMAALIVAMFDFAAWVQSIAAKKRFTIKDFEIQIPSSEIQITMIGPIPLPMPNFKLKPHGFIWPKRISRMIAGRRSFTKANQEPISAKDIIPLADTIGMAVTARGNLRVLGFLIATALFFGVTLLGSLFAMIVLLNQTDIPRKDGPSYLMIGLVPPSIATFFLYTKVFGRFL